MDVSAPDAERQPALTPVRRALHEALLATARVADPTLPLRALEHHLGLALHHVYRMLASRGDWQELASQEGAALAHVREAVMAAQSLGHPSAPDPASVEIASWAAQALRHLTSPPLVLDGEVDLPRGGEPDVVGTVDEPRLLAPARWPLVPVVPFPELEDPPEPEPEPAPLPPPITTLAELQARMAADAEAAEREDEKGDDAARPKVSRDVAPPPKPLDALAAEAEESRFGHPVPHEVIQQERVKGLMEDLAMFGLQRRPLAGAGWRDLQQLDQRLLCRVDALVACGPDVYGRVVKQLEGRPLPDPELTWAVVYLLGSIRGDDTLEQLVAVVRLAQLDDETMARSVADALAHAPHPGIEPWLRGWLASETPEWRELAMRVLGRRGALHVAVLIAALADPDPRVVLAAAQSIGNAPGDVSARDLEPLLQSSAPSLFRAGVRASILRLYDAGAARSLDLTVSGKGSFGSAAIYVAITQDAGVAGLLKGAAEADPSAVLLSALGWYGQVDAMDLLVATLAKEEAQPRAHLAAVEAMHRLTGAGLTDDDPAPEYDEGEQPFTPGWQPVQAVDLALDAAVWGAWWERWRHLAVADRRYRRGQLWTARENLRALEDPLSDHPLRRLTHLELVARSGVTLPLDQDLFVAAQLRQLEAWHRKLPASTKSGHWPTRLARHA